MNRWASEHPEAMAEIASLPPSQQNAELRHAVGYDPDRIREEHEEAEREKPRRELLVYGECVCGWHCACPEGYSWPKCPNCGDIEQVHPAAVNAEGGKKWGHGARMAYVAELMPEGDAVKALQGVERRSPNERVYTPEQVAQWRIDRGFADDMRASLHLSLARTHSEVGEAYRRATGIDPP